jgi:hypothetical protein
MKIKSILRVYKEGTGLVAHLVFKTSSRRIKPSVAGSIPAPSAFPKQIPLIK